MAIAPRSVDPGCPSPPSAGRRPRHKRRPDPERCTAAPLASRRLRPVAALSIRRSDRQLHSAGEVLGGNSAGSEIRTTAENETVGTTNKSIDAMPSAWLRKKVFQPCEV